MGNVTYSLNKPEMPIKEALTVYIELESNGNDDDIRKEAALAILRSLKNKGVLNFACYIDESKIRKINIVDLAPSSVKW